MNELKGYHAHVYYDAATKPVAERLRDTIVRKFTVEPGAFSDMRNHPSGGALPVGTRNQDRPVAELPNDMQQRVGLDPRDDMPREDRAPIADAAAYERGCAAREQCQREPRSHIKKSTRSAAQLSAVDLLDAVAVRAHRGLHLDHLAHPSVHQGAADG